MKVAKKPVAKRSAAKKPAQPNEHLWRVNMRGWREHPGLSIVAVGDDKDAAIAYAKELCIAPAERLGIKAKVPVPQVASVKELPGAYRVFSKSNSEKMQSTGRGSVHASGVTSRMKSVSLELSFTLQMQ